MTIYETENLSNNNYTFFKQSRYYICTLQKSQNVIAIHAGDYELFFNILLWEKGTKTATKIVLALSDHQKQKDIQEMPHMVSPQSNTRQHSAHFANVSLE